MVVKIIQNIYLFMFFCSFIITFMQVWIQGVASGAARLPLESARLPFEFAFNNIERINSIIIMGSINVFITLLAMKAFKRQCFCQRQRFQCFKDFFLRTLTFKLKKRSNFISFSAKKNFSIPFLFLGLSRPL